MGRFLNTNLTYLIHVELLKLSIPSRLHFGNLSISGSLFHSSFGTYWHKVVHNFFSFLLLFVESVLLFFIPFPILVI